jgi:hypothetical protein
MDTTQLGRAGELALDLYSLVTSDGDLELFAPVADDDHVDATAGRRGAVPSIAIQVKTARDVDRYGTANAKADYPAGDVREHPAFLYAVLLMPSITIDTAWIVPSPDFNRLAYHVSVGNREILEFRGDPLRDDSYASFRVPRFRLALGC